MGGWETPYLVGIEVLLAGQHKREDGACDGPVVDGAKEELVEEGGEECEDHVGLGGEVGAQGPHGGTVGLGFVGEGVGGQVVDGGGALGAQQGVD